MFGRKQPSPSHTREERQSVSPLDIEISRIVSQSADQHPLDVAARLAALFSTRDYRDDRIKFIDIQEIDRPTVCDMSRFDGDAVGLSFDFQGSAGERGLIYLTTSFAQLAPLGEEPGPRVPADFITRFVGSYVETVRALVAQRSPRRSPEELAQEERIRSRLSQFLG